MNNVFLSHHCACSFRTAGHFNADSVLSADEFREVVLSDRPHSMFVACRYNRDEDSLDLWRGDLSVVSVPRSWFEDDGRHPVSRDDIPEVGDFGHTILWGGHEFGAHTILKEFCPHYREEAERNRKVD